MSSPVEGSKQENGNKGDGLPPSVPVPRKEVFPPAAGALSGSTGRHARGVSWDLAAQGVMPPQAASSKSFLPTEEDAVSAVTQPPALTHGMVSLKDVTAITPMESEAETLLLSALEEKQPDVVETNALNNLTKEEDSLFTDQSNSQRALPLPQTSQPSLFSKSVAKDTTQYLWELTHHMKKTGTTGERLSEEEIPHEQAAGQSDLLAMRAEKLFSKRKGRIDTGTTPHSHGRPMVPSMAGQKWNKVRLAVQKNMAEMEDPKKNDDNIVPDQVIMTGTTKHTSSRDDIEQGNAGSYENQESGETGAAGSGRQANGPSELRVSKMHRDPKISVNEEFHAFREWVGFKKGSLFGYIRQRLLFAILPATGIAALLFYVGENPPCGTQEECKDANRLADLIPRNNRTDDEEESPLEAIFGAREERYDDPSVSWWILFIGVRQVVTLALARMFEAIIIDFWVMRSRLAPRILGPYLSLLIVQAKGWPIQLVLWGLLDLGMLYGDRPFARHWLYWQDYIDLFNETNPAGNVTTSNQYKALLALMCAIGGLVAFKRFFIGLRLGQKTCSRYNADLAKILKKTILVSEVATLAKEIRTYDLRTESFGLHTEIYNEEEDGSKAASANEKSLGKMTTIADLVTERKIRISELLGEWEEPELASDREEAVDIASVIQFRKSLSYLDTSFPFSYAFGPASTREACLRSAETVYKQLKMAAPNGQHVVFDTLALTSIQQDGTMDDYKLRELIKIFRPDRDGNLSLLDFCKSVDSVYKELRLFLASVDNAARVDRAVEKIFNFAFYFIVACISLAILGIDPLALFAAISGFVLGFAFMIGAACSKYFEGLLMIFITKPYDIGDKIQVAPVTADSSGTGSSYWLVKDVGLYHTTYMFWTQETATCSNGTLASTRIINASRSPQAILTYTFKFPIDTPYRKIEIFKNTIEKFVKNRPREWLSFLAFRPTRVEANAGFVEYVFLAQHRENWANLGALKNSLAGVTYFGLEVSKKMGMRYTAPPMPIDLNMVGNDTSQNLHREMASQLKGQSDRLSQPVLASGEVPGDTNFSLHPPRSPGEASQNSYDFADIEAMFNKNK